MKTRNSLILIALGGLVALVACSSSEADKFGSSDQFCSAKAEAECNNLAKPCGASVDACKTKRAQTCNAGAATAAGQGRSYRANAAQGCIDKVNEIYKDSAGNVTPDGEASVTKVCERVFGGSKAERTPCANTYECEGSLICDGVCSTEETVSLNGGCANAGQVCATGLYCQASGGTGKRFCVDKNKLGDQCGDTNPCLETLRCVTGRCVDKVTVGNPCDNDSECAVEAPFCDLTTTPKKCRPKYQAGTSACRDFGSSI
jgi:hypothetical protein